MIICKASPADVASIAKVHVDAWQATYPGIVPAEYLASLEYERSARRWDALLGAGAAHVFVAEDGLGCVYDANLSAIYVLPEHQRRGLGRALMAAAVEALRADGRRALLVWVLRDNTACGFYEQLGGTAVYTREQAIGGARLPVVGYGWPSLVDLAAVLTAGTPSSRTPA